MELTVKEYLDSVANSSTRKGYRLGIKKFCQWFGKPAKEVLQLRKDDLTQKPAENLIDYRNRAARFQKEIEKFHSYLLEQGYTINTARNMTLGIRQLFRFYQMPTRIRTGSRVNKTVKTSKNFPLRIEHVREMFKFADLKAKVILSMAVDLGLRIGDFIKIKKTSVSGLEDEPPIAFTTMTGKEKILANGFISGETVQLLKLYLPTLKKDNSYLFQSNGNTHVSDEWVNSLLRTLSGKARFPLNGKKLTFHCFRKMFLSASIDSGIGLTAGKKLCGKAIPESDDTYLTTVQLRKKFMQLKRFLTIKQKVKPEDHEKIAALKSAVAKLQEESHLQKTVTQTVTEENIKIRKELHTLNDMINPLQPMLEFVNSFESPDAMMEFLEAIKERSATARQRAERMPKLTKKARELLHEAVSDIIQKESQRVKQLLSKKTGITNEDILQAAIQAARESIEEEYGIESRAKEEGY